MKIQYKPILVNKKYQQKKLVGYDWVFVVSSDCVQDMQGL
jgi:hypothetical protein